jgi:hypothetical protein
MRIILVWSAILGLGAGSAAAEIEIGAAANVLRQAFATACREAGNRANAISRRIYWPQIKDQDGPASRRVEGLTRLLFRAGAGDELRITVYEPGGRLRRITAEVHSNMAPGGVRPVLMAIGGSDCRIVLGRRIEYGDDGRPRTLAFLNADLRPSGRREPLDAPVPAGSDPGGIAVALIDSGVNYTLASLAARLARDGAGRALGYDYWDMDARPFDLDTSRSPFFPIRHGTRVASILLREAPAVRLIPYRYPRPDLGRMADLVADADAKGSIIIALPMGSNKRADWAAFETAARARAHLLFIVSAGNNGRDIDTTPVYPAALPLDNLLVVTSADGKGRLAAGSNWGVRHVDLMVPGEQQPVINFRGASTVSSGSSYAVPRIAAMAARLLDANPGWRAPELKRAIIARARPSPYHRLPVVAHGWIAAPDKDE